MHQIHTGRAPQYLAHSVELIAESSRRPDLRLATPLTTLNVALELNSDRCLVTMVQLPGIPYLDML